MPDQQYDREAPYTNRELREKWHDMEVSIQEILSHVTRTNGRVTALERWKYVGMGAASVMTLIVLPLLSWSILMLFNISMQVASVEAQHQLLLGKN